MSSANLKNVNPAAGPANLSGVNSGPVTDLNPATHGWHGIRQADTFQHHCCEDLKDSVRVAFLPEIRYYDVPAEKLKWRGDGLSKPTHAHA